MRARWADADADVRRYTRVVTVAGLLSLVAYVAVLWGFALQPDRTAFGDASFSNFYDVQAHAMLGGNLDLPEGELGIEAFVEDGREYMYFPPGPALVRMPLLAVTDAFDGLLTAPMMLAAWTMSTVLLALLFWRVRRILRGRAPLHRGEAVGYGVLLASTTAGSVTLFLASMPFVYHEAYSWAIATSLGAAYCMLGFLERPARSQLVGAALFTLGAVLSRTTAGWACAIALLLIAAWALSRRAEWLSRRWVVPLLVAALAPLAVGIAFNWAKFRHPYMFPLDDQVWTSVNEQRRLALDANGGDLVSTKIFPSTSAAYFRPDGIRFTGVFPWITLPARPAAEYGGSYLDQSYRTGSVVSFMPLLFLLSVWGVITAFRPRGRKGMSLLRIPLFGLALIPGAILFYGYIAYRYTSELIPVLALGAVVGFVDVARRLEGRRAGRRRAVLAAGAALAVFGFVANLAVSVGTSRLNNPGTSLTQLVRVQEELSDLTPGRPFDDLLFEAPTLPVEGPADRIQVVDDCTAVYVGTGEPLWPWVPLEIRELAWELDLSERAPGRRIEITLATPRDYPTDGVQLIIEDDTFRGRFETAAEVLGRRARPIPEDGRLRIRLVVDLTLQQYVLVDVDDPERGLVDIEASLPMPDWFRQQLIFDDEVPEATTIDGVQVRPVETAPLPLCEHLQARLAESAETDGRHRRVDDVALPAVPTTERPPRGRHVG